MAPLIFKGVVTSIGKMSKTVTVTITRKVEHKKLKAAMTRTTKILAHDEDHLSHLGDHVSIIHGIEYSPRKHFRLYEIDRTGKKPEEFPKAEEWKRLEQRSDKMEENKVIHEASEKKRRDKEEKREKRIRAAIESSKS